MTRLHCGSLLALACVLAVGTAAHAGSIVIGGSSTLAPPTYNPNWFWGVNPNITRAFGFTVPAGGPYLVQQAEVAAYAYSGLAPNEADFSINADAGGQPGAALVSFTMTGLPTSPAILTAPASSPVLLQSGENYWFTGSVPTGQLNWNIAGNEYAPMAYLYGGAWTVYPGTYSNTIAAYAVLADAVPEPGTLGLLALSGAALLSRRRVKRA